MLLIEAKKLALTRAPIQQLVAYVATENIRRDHKVSFCAWTNGDVWKVIDIPAQKEVLDVQVSRDDPAECAFKLLGLWRTSLVDGSLRAPVKLPTRQRQPVPAPLRHVPQPPTGELLEPQDHSTSKLSQGHDRTLASFDADIDGQPTSIAFPGEAARPLQNQKELIVSVANYLVRIESLTPANGTLQSGGKRYIVHSSPTHPNGKPFKAGVMLHNGLHLETSNPLSQTIKYAQKLLEHFGQVGLSGRVKLDL